MSKQQPEALRLAAALDELLGYRGINPDVGKAAAELRRLQSVKGHNGMTLREYAAIQLKVPDSGTDWLDDMIRKSQRNDLAAKAMQTLLLDDSYDFSDRDLIARKAYAYADAMITAREAA
jgi:hypothetical protein